MTEMDHISNSQIYIEYFLKISKKGKRLLPLSYINRIDERNSSETLKDIYEETISSNDLWMYKAIQ